jgi:hypothetical protein
MQKCSIALCLVPKQPYLLPHMVGFFGPQARVLQMCDLDTFHLPTISNPDQSDQACILPTVGINAI